MAFKKGVKLKMYGFILKWGNCELPEKGQDLECGRMIEWEDFSCIYNPMPRFEEDKIFVQNENYIYLLDGVIYNKNELLTEFKENSWAHVFIQLYLLNSSKFVDRLRGTFRGFILDKKSLELVLFTNHSGEKDVFYSKVQNGFIAATNMDFMLSVYHKNKISYQMNLQSANELLTLGYIIGGKSIVKGVSRLSAGEKLLYKKYNSEMKLEKYWFLKNIPEMEITDESIKEFDKLYRQAVERIFAKSKEYGYKYEADLSGGLDTRMVNWVAHDLGYNNVINVNYCIPKCLDYKIAKKISKDLGNEFVYYSMENGDFLKDIDEMIPAYSGQVLYFIATGANRSYKKILDRNIGIAATGLVGEMCNAYWRIGETHSVPQVCNNRYSKKIELENTYDCSEYDNYEHYNHYMYSLGFFLKSGLIRNQWFEFASPYVDKDFAEFAFRIPLQERINYKFYTKWILTCYPEAGNYLWQTKKRPLNKKIYLRTWLWEAARFSKRSINKIFQLMNVRHRFTYIDDMNPFQAWFENNKELREFVDNYYKDTIDLVTNTELRTKIQKVFSGNGIDKLVAINMLGINKRYFYEA